MHAGMRASCVQSCVQSQCTAGVRRALAVALKVIWEQQKKMRAMSERQAAFT